MRRIGIVALCAATAVLAISSVGVASAWASSYGAAGWGEDNYGQLGNDETGWTAYSDVPVTVSEISEVAAVSAGQNFSLALLKNGTVEAWGDNSYGELGNGSTASSDVPVAVSGLSEVVAVSAGSSTGMALMKNGTVKTWGLNASGNLGYGSESGPESCSYSTNCSRAPVEVSGLSEVVAISAGSLYGVALLKNGTVKAWGDNSEGELGDGTTSDSDVPVTVSGLSEVIAVSGGSWGGLALLKGGTVKAWGTNSEGALGDGSFTGPETCSSFGPCSTTPVNVTELSEVAAISAGDDVGLALHKSGTVDAWGWNENGELGDGTTTSHDTPAEVSELRGVTAISAGQGSYDAGHGLALLEGGTVKAWGDNTWGELGDGLLFDSYVPVNVETSLTGMNEVSGISAGYEDSLAYGPSIPGPQEVPIVTGVSPDIGYTGGGASVSVTGEKFTHATAVEFDGTRATTVTVHSATSITAVAPSGKPRTTNVTVIGPGGSSVTNAHDRFTYVPEGIIEFGKCTKVGAGKGKYSDAGCTEGKTGAHEWTPGVVAGGFTSADETEVIEKVVTPKKVQLETVAKTKLTCDDERGTGTYLAPGDLADVVIKLTGCELSGAKCTSAGSAEGEAVTSSLEGGLGWLAKEGNNVGVDLAPVEEAEPFLEATCGSSSVDVRGSVIAHVSPINLMSSTFTLKFREKEGKQTFEHFEGEANDVLEMSVGGGSFKQAGLALETTLTGEEGLEINTVV